MMNHLLAYLPRSLPSLHPKVLSPLECFLTHVAVSCLVAVGCSNQSSKSAQVALASPESIERSSDREATQEPTPATPPEQHPARSKTVQRAAQTPHKRSRQDAYGIEEARRANSDQAGGCPEDTQRVFFVGNQESLASSNDKVPLHLKVMCTDGSNLRVLATLPTSTTRVSLAPGEPGQALVRVYFRDKRGANTGQGDYLIATAEKGVHLFQGINKAAFVGFDSSNSAVFEGESHWKTQSNALLTHKSGVIQPSRSFLSGKPFFVSRSGKWVAVEKLTSSELVDKETGSVAVVAQKVGIPDHDKHCGTIGTPGYWLSNDETQAFVYPGANRFLQLAKLQSGQQSKLSTVAKTLRPVAYDRCQDRLIAYSGNGTFYAVKKEGTVTRLSKPTKLSIAHIQEAPERNLSPDGRYVVGHIYNNLIGVVDLQTGATWQRKIPSTRVVHVKNVSRHWAVLKPYGQSEPLFLLHLQTREFKSVSSCVDPQLTNDGSKLLCRKGDKIELIETAIGKNEVTELATGVAEFTLAPGISPCIDRRSRYRTRRWCS